MLANHTQSKIKWLKVLRQKQLALSLVLVVAMAALYLGLPERPAPQELPSAGQTKTLVEQIDSGPGDPLPNDWALEELSRAAAAKRHFGPKWRRVIDIGVRFEAHYEKALGGDSDSAMDLLDVLQDCQMVVGVDSESQIRDMYLTVAPTFNADDVIEAMVFLLRDCRQVWNRMPAEHANTWAWRAALIEVAANSDDPTAKLMQMDAKRMRIYALQSLRGQQSPPDDDELSKISELLNSALRTGDHRAYEQARALFNYYEDTSHGLQADFWNLAICSHDPGCDFAMDRSNHTHLFSHELDIISDAIRRLGSRLENPDPIPFQKMLTHPLQMPDGSMWFEQDER